MKRVIEILGTVKRLCIHKEVQVEATDQIYLYMVSRRW